MQVKAILLAAITTYGVADAVCVMRAWSGPNCDGAPGQPIEIGKGNSCIGVSGRKSYHVYGGTCGNVRIIKYKEDKCSGPHSTVDLPTGKCRRVGSFKNMNIKKV